MEDVIYGENPALSESDIAALSAQRESDRVSSAVVPGPDLRDWLTA